MKTVRRWAPLLALLAGILVVAAITGSRGPTDGPPLDPRSTGAVGTAALVETLRLLDAHIQMTTAPPARTDGTALLLVDPQDSTQHEDLLRWVRAGGTLVVADPRSPLGATPAGETAAGLPRAVIRPECPLPALAGVGEVNAPGGIALEAPDGALACFPRSGGHWLVAVDEGEGALVSLGGPEVWTNRTIGSADNALLAAALLAPEPRSRVAILQPPRPGEGDATLADVLDPRVPAALLQLGLAFLLFVLWRGRRLGVPPEERHQVTIPAAELVVAAGSLYQQAGARGRAAQLIRDDLRGALRRRLGLPPSSDDGALVAACRRSPGVDPEQVRAFLAADPPDDRSLIALAQQAESLRRDLSEPSPQGADRAG